jgi:hypothetical protein
MVATGWSTDMKSGYWCWIDWCGRSVDLVGNRLYRSGGSAGRHHAVWQYTSTVGVGFNWRLPYPIRHEVGGDGRSIDVGRDTSSRLPGLHQAMLTGRLSRDQICGAYRLSDARAHLFERSSAVVSGETAVREVVGKMKMDSGAGRGT